MFPFIRHTFKFAIHQRLDSGGGHRVAFSALNARFCGVFIFLLIVGICGR